MIDIWCIYAVNLREKVSQIMHFCGVKFLAWKSSSEIFWTNIMSELAHYGIFGQCREVDIRFAGNSCL